MCGIVGYVGRRKASEIVIEGLKKLEYRGYDSAGVAYLSLDGQVQVAKSSGAVSELEKKIGPLPDSSVAIGHTRWATHGAPSERNSHPHLSHHGELAIVHNGIIENYEDLKEKLISNAYSFKSDTDTEVLGSWIEFVMRRDSIPLPEAVTVALADVVGAYAICVVQPGVEQIVVARRSSPIAIGIGEHGGEKEFIVASDATPVVPYTDNLVYLDDNQVAVINEGELLVRNLDSDVVSPEVRKVDVSDSKIDMDGWESFMMKEINEQPSTILNCLRGRLTSGENEIVLGGLSDYMPHILRSNKITIVACGTSWHSALVGKWMIESLARIPVEVDYASEFSYRSPIVNSGDVVIGITQSGETADTKAALEEAGLLGATTVGVVNVVGSSIARLAHTGIYTHSGVEVGVASTKAFTGQVAALALMAIKIGRQLGHLGDERFWRLKDSLRNIPSQVDKILLDTMLIESIADEYVEYDDFLYRGRGISFPVALEGA